MEFFGVRPERRVAALFVAAILAGTILLMLPAASMSEPLRFVDALFTSTSAACVTGLTAVDTATRLSLFGQLVVLALIQLGGLGIMTFTTALVLSAGGSLSLADREGVLGTLSMGGRIDARALIKTVFVSTVVIEAIGAALLFLRFAREYPVGRALYYAVFHSVAAFCNAGFSTFSTNLEGYHDDYLTIGIIALLIICGGLGFVVIHELMATVAGRSIRLSIHSKICLVMTLVLLVGGAVLIFTAERGHALAGTGRPLDLVNAFFQSVTARTAGFNTIPQADLTEFSLLVTIILMFIGTCPGSTGGGIKTTTIALVLLLAVRRFTGNQQVSVFQRTIATESWTKAVAVLLLAVFVVLVMFSLFMFAEGEMISHAASRGWFIEGLFEVVSAFGTVGLSLGITPGLTDAGKVVLVLMMYIGRIGLLTLALSLAGNRQRGELVYAQEEVMVG